MHVDESQDADFAAVSLLPADVVELPLAYQKNNGLFADYLKHLRRGYVDIQTPECLPDGQKLRLRCTAPCLKEPFICLGEVKTIHSDEFIGMRIHLRLEKEDKRKELFDWIERQLQDAFGPELAQSLLLVPAPSSTTFTEPPKN